MARDSLPRDGAPRPRGCGSAACGRRDAQVDAAAKVIQELLTPKEDSENEWKRMQLRELAMINGARRAGDGGWRGAGGRSGEDR